MIERLLLLVVPARKGADAPGAAERVEFVDEDDRWRLLVCLLKQVSHPRRADADEHLDELRTGYREERHLGFASHGLGQQGLAGAGRTDQQHALGHASPEPAVVGRAFQEVDNLAQFVLGFVDAGDVGKIHAGVGLDIDLRLAFADCHQAAAKAATFCGAFGDVPPQAEEQQHRHHP